MLKCFENEQLIYGTNLDTYVSLYMAWEYVHVLKQW